MSSCFPGGTVYRFSDSSLTFRRQGNVIRLRKGQEEVGLLGPTTPLGPAVKQAKPPRYSTQQLGPQLSRPSRHAFAQQLETPPPCGGWACDFETRLCHNGPDQGFPAGRNAFECVNDHCMLRLTLGIAFRCDLRREQVPRDESHTGFVCYMEGIRLSVGKPSTKRAPPLRRFFSPRFPQGFMAVVDTSSRVRNLPSIRPSFITLPFLSAGGAVPENCL